MWTVGKRLHQKHHGRGIITHLINAVHAVDVAAAAGWMAG